MSFSRFMMGSYNWADGSKRTELMQMAKASEAAERYDDMCSFMKKLVEVAYANGKKDGLTVEERNLLSVAYKNVIGARRASWRTVTGEYEGNYPENVKEMFKKYKVMIEDELKAICDEILDVLTLHCVDSEYNPTPDEKSADGAGSGEGEAQVFYLKMAGDYYRYLAETVSDKEYENKTDKYYKSAMTIAEQALQATHPIRLGLALNYSVCHYEILKDKKAACELAKAAFDDAISKLDALEEADYKDSTLIMQLLRDNLTLWTSSTEEEGEDN